MHAILSASAGQEQLLTELLVSYTKVRLLGCSSEPRARPSALSRACRVDSVQFWNKMMKDLLYHWQRLWWFASVAFLKKIKGQTGIFACWFLVPLWRLLWSLRCTSPLVADLCTMPEVSQPQNIPGCSGMCGALALPSSSGSSSPFAAQRALC